MPTDKRLARLSSGSNSIFGVLGLVLLVCFAVLLTGCDGRPSRVKISGQITVDGKPLEHGGYTFKPVGGGRVAGGGIKEGGHYVVSMYEKGDGLPVGSYTLSINPTETINARTLRWHAPKRYVDHETSELTVEITEARSDLDFDLTWEGDKHSEPWVEKL